MQNDFSDSPTVSWLKQYLSKCRIFLQVELHMRYIELQRALQSRLSELERLCERERSILMGRWKTHSLPARKRTPSTATTSSNQSQPSPSSSFTSPATPCCRPAASTEHLLLYSVVRKKKKMTLHNYAFWFPFHIFQDKSLINSLNSLYKFIAKWIIEIELKILFLDDPVRRWKTMSRSS